MGGGGVRRGGGARYLVEGDVRQRAPPPPEILEGSAAVRRAPGTAQNAIVDLLRACPWLTRNSIQRLLPEYHYHLGQPLRRLLLKGVLTRRPGVRRFNSYEWALAGTPTERVLN